MQICRYASIHVCIYVYVCVLIYLCVYSVYVNICVYVCGVGVCVASVSSLCACMCRHFDPVLSTHLSFNVSCHVLRCNVSELKIFMLALLSIVTRKLIAAKV